MCVCVRISVGFWVFALRKPVYIGDFEIATVIRIYTYICISRATLSSIPNLLIKYRNILSVLNVYVQV